MSLRGRPLLLLGGRRAGRRGLTEPVTPYGAGNALGSEFGPISPESHCYASQTRSGTRNSLRYAQPAP